MSENEKVVGTVEMTVEQAKQHNQDKSQSGKTQKVEKKGPPIAVIIVALVILGVLGFFIWIKMSSGQTQEVVQTQEPPQTIDTVNQSIQYTQPTYNTNSSLQDNSIAEDTSFFVDDSIVYRDQVTGQYMIKFRNTAYVIDSDLGKEAIKYYQSQGTDVLVLLQRLQEKEQNQIQNNAQIEQPTIDNNHVNSQLQAEIEDLKGLVQVQDQTIQELKRTLITLAQSSKQKAATASIPSAASTISIPKGAKSIEAVAVVGDRAWVSNSDKVISVIAGDQLPDSRKVYAVDENRQIIWVK